MDGFLIQPYNPAKPWIGLGEIEQRQNLFVLAFHDLEGVSISIQKHARYGP